MRRVFAAMCVLSLLLCGLGCARHHTASVDEVFIHYDTDRDGVITKKEFTSQWKDQIKAEAAWKRVDKTQRGSLSRPQANAVPLDVWSELEQNNIH